MATNEEYQLGNMSKSQTEKRQKFNHDIALNETKDGTCMRTDVTTSIKRLNVVCIVLTIVVIIMAVTIGILLSDLKKGEGATEGNVDVLQARVEHIKSETELKTVEDTATMDNQSTRLTRLESDFQDFLSALEKNNNTISQLESDRTNDFASIQSVLDLESNMTDGIASIQSFHTTITDLEDVMTDYTKQKSYASAFTAWKPSTGTATSPIKFATVISNIGSDYDSFSGKFTCRFPGIYMFILNLYKRNGSYSYVYCYIQTNGLNTVKAYNYPYSSVKTGYYEASSSVVLHLNRGDVVTVGGCNGYILSLSSFTGILVKVD